MAKVAFWEWNSTPTLLHFQRRPAQLAFALRNFRQFLLILLDNMRGIYPQRLPGGMGARWQTLLLDGGCSGSASRARYICAGRQNFRINPDGSIPSDNPFPGSPVWTLGHRNPQGLAFQPGTSLLWSTEHGPDVKDELNTIKKGKGLY